LYLLKWIFISAIAGTWSSTLVHLFLASYRQISAFLIQLDIPLFVWPLIGAVITFGGVYPFSRAAAGEGMPAYISGVNRHKAHFSLKVTVVKLAASVTTLLTFGSGGVVGPIGRVNAGLLSVLLEKIKKAGFTDFDRRTAGICGMAATVGALFHSSVGGGIFAVEIIQKTEMRYRDLFPAILSSAIAAQFSRAMGWSPFFSASLPKGTLTPKTAVFILITAVTAGLLGKVFIQTYRLFAGCCNKTFPGAPLLKAAAASLAAGLAAWTVHPSLFGTSKGIIDFLLLSETTAAPLPLFSLSLGTAFLFILIKGGANILTVGSGMSAGFTGPSLIMGMLVGYIMAKVTGAAPYSIEYYAMLSAGFAATLGSSINVPIAAAVIGVELFGIHYGLPCGLAAIIGFQINRHYTLYDYAKNGRPTGR
jgi:CIC family chloride channel protein